MMDAKHNLGGEMLRVCLATIAIMLTIVPACGLGPVPAPRRPPARAFIAAVSSYLKAHYSPAAGLYRAAPHAAPNTFWVYSDAYLAGLDVSGWHVPPFRRWTVLVEQAVVPEDVFRSATRVIKLGNGVQSEVEDPKSPGLADWQEFADRLLFAAINARNAGNTARERQLMGTVTAMWTAWGCATRSTACAATTGRTRRRCATT